MQLGLGPLFAQLERAPNADYVLATVIGTEGSSYRKSGAMMLITPDAEPIGLVSGGCLESDIREHARAVFADRQVRFVRYDLSTDDAELWGLGLGCGGAIDIMLEAADQRAQFAGLRAVHDHWQRSEFCWLVKGVSKSSTRRPLVSATDEELPGPARELVAATRARRRAASDSDTLLIPVLPPHRLTICGAGPDAVPLAALATISGWRVTVMDHRKGFAQADRFALGVNVQSAAIVALTDTPYLAHTDAVVVMSHHLENDAAYLRAAHAGDARYIGLLGPRARRDDVLDRAGVTPDTRLHGPAGLDIGADLPETIALSILAQAQAVLSGAVGGSLA